MAREGPERRACERFVVPGAVVHFKKEDFFFHKDFTESPHPIFDISRGGLRFLSQDRLKIDTGVLLKIVIPGDEAPLIVKGRVMWLSINHEISYKYQIGVQFDPYGKRVDENDLEILQRLSLLEQRFLNRTASPGK